MCSSPQINLPLPESFDISGDVIARRVRWREWRETWERYAEAVGLSVLPIRRQISILLSILGPKCRLIAQLDARETGERWEFRVDQVLDRLADHILPDLPEDIARGVVKDRSQRAGESILEYVAALHDLVTDVELDWNSELDYVRDVFVEGLADNNIRCRLRLMRDQQLCEIVKEAGELEIHQLLVDRFEKEFRAKQHREAVRVRSLKAEQARRKCVATRQRTGAKPRVRTLQSWASTTKRARISLLSRRNQPTAIVRAEPRSLS